MIYFTTKAYNAEKTLRRTVESILSQTYGDFRYYLCDNASTDGTGDMIREYARLDSRIVPLFNAQNLQWLSESRAGIYDIYEMMSHLEPEDWVSVLDADDDYTPDFLEEMLRFSTEYDLDFAACRSNHIQEPEGLDRNEFVLEQDIIVEGEQFGTRFPDYFRFMGARWAKLQKGTLFQEMDLAAFRRWMVDLSLRHRSDTAAEMYFLHFSRRAGVRARLLHNYHLYPASYRTKNLDRKQADNLKMPAVYREFLMKKVGYVSPENEAYIQEVFLRSQRRTLEQEGKNDGAERS